MINEPYLISGNRSAPATYQSRRPFSGALKILVGLWLLSGVGFLVWKLVAGSAKPGEKVASPAASMRVAAVDTEDLRHHVYKVNDNLDNATVRLKRVEALILQAIPHVERNYLLVETQRLENALAATEAARRDLEQGREETNLVLNNLITKEQEHQ